MRVLLVYDISSDRVRGKVADACMDYGLDRIQYSAFAGDLSRSHQEELFMRIKKLLDGSGRVWLIPVAETEWTKRLEIDNA